jgi:pSer/pThr/pTyr-binding forkhead associated (FHA) protein
MPTFTFERVEGDDVDTDTRPAVPDGPALRTGALMGLRVVSSGDVLSLLGRVNYTLGRSIETQSVVPDIDLAPFDAFDQGVSRLHAEMRIQPDGVFIVDLDSANGTHVNGKRLEALKAIPIHHGDIVQLGSMRLQLISRYRS